MDASETRFIVSKTVILYFMDIINTNIDNLCCFHSFCAPPSHSLLVRCRAGIGGQASRQELKMQLVLL